jgi:hypothetical protein
MDSFLAHEDIEPSSPWQEVIVNRLRSTDILVCILTEAFYKSEWTQQEVGIAFGNGKTILSVSVDGVGPIGFTKQLQALGFKSASWTSTKLKENQNSSPYLEVFKVIARYKEWQDKARRCLIRGLVDSSSFLYANSNTALLGIFSHYPRIEVNELVRGAITNDNLIQGWRAAPILREFCRRRMQAVGLEYRRTFRELYGVK